MMPTPGQEQMEQIICAAFQVLAPEGTRELTTSGTLKCVVDERIKAAMSTNEQVASQFDKISYDTMSLAEQWRAAAGAR